MSDFQQMARVLAPVLVTLMAEPFWVGVFRPGLDVTADPAGPALDVWVGRGFENWRPNEDYAAIIAVTTARAFVVPTLCSSRRSKPARPRRRPARVVCAVSAEGEAYAALVLARGQLLVEGEPQGGRMLDSLLAKFGLPPGPPCPYDLELTQHSRA
jgi:hypothetical protein